MSNEVKRWQAWVIADEFNMLQPIPEFFVADDDHDRIVAEHVLAIKKTDERWRESTDQLLTEIVELRAEVDRLRELVEELIQRLENT